MDTETHLLNKYQLCPECGRQMHPDYPHIWPRDCQIALAAALGSVTEFAENLEKSLMRRLTHEL